MQSHIQDILNKANEILAGTTSTVKDKEAFKGIVPLRRMVFYTFLTDVDTLHVNLEHIYLTALQLMKKNGDVKYIVNSLSVLHGHTSDIPCAAPHFCHQYGYKPKMTDNPAFIQTFNNNWRWLYEN